MRQQSFGRDGIHCRFVVSSILRLPFLPFRLIALMGFLFLLGGAHLDVMGAVSIHSIRDTTLSGGDTVEITPSPLVERDTVEGASVRVTADHEIVAIDTSRLTDGNEAAREDRGHGPSRWNSFCDSMPQGYVALAAVMLPGAGQVINRQYWKIPIFYGAIGGFTGLGIYGYQRYRSLSMGEAPTDALPRLEYDSKMANWRFIYYGAFVAAGISYSLSVADALISHSPHHQSPTAALVSSLLLPGLGQVYNGAYWKVPIIYGAGFWLTSQFVRSQRLYKRFDNSLLYLLDDDPGTVNEFGTSRSKEELEHYRDYYQRNRDIYVIGLSLLYFLNVVDAYVDAHLFYWNVDENLALRAEPLVQPLQGNADGVALAVSLRLDFE